MRRENTAKLTLVGECAAGIDGRMSLGPSKVPCLSLNSFFLFFSFGCWKQLTLTRQAIRHLTGHLNWPLCNKISGLLSAVSGPFELAFMQQGGIRAAQMQSPVMRLPAGQSLQILSEMVLEHMVKVVTWESKQRHGRVWKQGKGRQSMAWQMQTRQDAVQQEVGARSWPASVRSREVVEGVQWCQPV